MLRKWIIGLCVPLSLTIGAQAQPWVGRASFYGHRGRTASGGHVGGFTAAHRTLPFGTKVRVTNLGNRRSVIVTIDDRGPFVHGRVIDVSTQAAQSLDFRAAGLARVKVETVSD